MTLWTVAYQAPLSMGFPRQEYWSGLPFSSPEVLPNPGIEPRSPALQVVSLHLSHQGCEIYTLIIIIASSTNKPQHPGSLFLNKSNSIFLKNKFPEVVFIFP